MRPAAREELAGLWPAIGEARLFPDFDSFARWWGDGPWRVRVSEQGNAVVLGRWRQHLPILAMLGVWCPQRHIATLAADVAGVASERGFERALGPLVPQEAARAYLEAGFEIAERIVMCRSRVRSGALVAKDEVEGDVRIRQGGPADETEVLALDARCFDDFWRYDRPTLEALAATERLTVAERGGTIIGYTLWVVHGTEAAVARLAVDPGERRHGVGSALLRDAVARVAQAGARAVTLTTQEDNSTSRRLYGREGFRESPGRLVYTVSPPPHGAGDRAGKG